MNKLKGINKIHMIGIGGSGMNGLAEILMDLGYNLSGSDIKKSVVTEELERLGANIFYSHDESSLNLKGVDLVVISSAIASDNPELSMARKNNISIIKRAKMLGFIMDNYNGIAVAGTHGKTTTTSLIANIFVDSDLFPTYVIGGVLKSANKNAKLGGGEFLIAEADESDASFLYLNPKIIVITNIDYDHMETYQNNLSILKNTFIEFIKKLPKDGYLVVCIDDPVVREIVSDIKHCCNIITYGFSDDADFVAKDYKQKETRSFYTIISTSWNIFEEVKLNIPGRHNVLNSIAAFIVANIAKIDSKKIISSLNSFKGVGRRFQVHDVLIGCKSVKLIDDYGHHPKEIAVTIEAIRDAWPDRRLVLAFQPHRYTRTNLLFDDFVSVLSKADFLLLFNVYSAGEAKIDGADSASLLAAIGNDSILIEDISMAEEYIAKYVLDGDVLLMQGAGSIGSVVEKIVKK